MEQPLPSPPPLPQHPRQPLSPSDEHTYALLAHLSVLLNVFTVLLVVLVPLVIYLVYRDRSKYVAYQALQAFVFQLVWWVGSLALIIAGWIFTSIATFLFVGLLCIPFNLLSLLLPLFPLVYGVYAAVKCQKGEEFKYWLVGDWVRTRFMAG
jgi:uncharacterized Tic20 family protein